MQTGLFLHGDLPPARATGIELFEKKIVSSTNQNAVVHGHDGMVQHDHKVTITTTVTETTPHGAFHGFGEKLAPWAFTNNAPFQQGAFEIWIYGRDFFPNVLTVPAGTRVTWINKSPEQHTVTSNESLFDSITYLKGSVADSFSHSFTQPGIYSFYCRPHNGMTGKIIVTPQ